MSKRKVFVRQKKEDTASIDGHKEVTATPQVISKDTNEEGNNIQIKANKITYESIYKFLLSMLGNNKFLLDKILQLARILFKEGVRTPGMKASIIKQKKKRESINKDVEKGSSRSK